MSEPNPVDNAKSPPSMKVILTWLVVVSLCAGYMSIPVTKTVKFAEIPLWARYQGIPVKVGSQPLISIPKEESNPVLEYQHPNSEPKRVVLSDHYWNEESSMLIISRNSQFQGQNFASTGGR